MPGKVRYNISYIARTHTRYDLSTGFKPPLETKVYLIIQVTTMPKPVIIRSLRFESLDEIEAEAHRLVAHPDPPTTGNWTPAQSIWHVARYIRASVEGYPTQMPWLMRKFGPLMKRRTLERGFKPGWKLPQSTNQHMVADAQTTGEQAIEMMREWVHRSKTDGFLPQNPILGPMTREDWIALHCRHAEMHFGLFDLADPAPPT